MAQRRRRVFIVGHLGEPCPTEILFERESVFGDSAPSRQKGEGIARTTKGGIDEPDGREVSTLSGTGEESYGFNWQNGGGYRNANDGLGISKEHTPPLSTSQVVAVTNNLISAAGFSTYREKDTASSIRCMQAKQADTDLVIGDKILPRR